MLETDYTLSVFLTFPAELGNPEHCPLLVSKCTLGISQTVDETTHGAGLGPALEATAEGSSTRIGTWPSTMATLDTDGEAQGQCRACFPICFGTPLAPFPWSTVPERNIRPERGIPQPTLVDCAGRSIHSWAWKASLPTLRSTHPMLSKWHLNGRGCNWMVGGWSPPGTYLNPPTLTRRGPPPSIPDGKALAF